MTDNNTASKVPQPHNNRREIVAVLVGGLLFLTVFFAPFLFSNSLIYSGDFGSSDLLELNIPRRILAMQTLRQGEFPLWEPHLSNGLPLLGEGQTGILNPLSLPFYALFNPTLATDCVVIATLLLAFCGCYWLCREHGSTPLAAAFGALGFALGGVFIFRLRHLNMIQAAAYLPLLLVLLRRYAQSLYRHQRVYVWSAAIGAVLVCQIFTGHPHLTYLTWLVSIIYIVSALWGDDTLLSPSNADPEAQPLNRGRLIGRAICQLLIVAVIALLLCAVQLLPTYELSQLATRSQPYTWESLRDYPFGWRDVERLVDPYIFGNPAVGTYERSSADHGVFWEVTAYIGILPLVLALFTLKQWRQRRLWWQWGLAIFFLLASMGPQAYIYGLFWKFCPGFDLFRCPSRFLFAFSLFLAVLSSLGATHIEKKLIDKGKAKLAVFIAILALIVTGADLARISYRYQVALPSTWQNPPATVATIGPDAKVYTPTYLNSWQENIGSRGWRNAYNQVMMHRSLLNQDLSAIWGVYQNSDSNVIDGGLSFAPYRHLQMFQFQQLLSTMDAKGTMAVNPELVDSLRRQGVTHILTFHRLRNAAQEPQLAPEQTYADPTCPQPVLYIYPLAKPLGRVHLAGTVSTTPPPYMQYMLDMFKADASSSVFEYPEYEPVGKATITAESANALSIDCQNDAPSLLVINNVCLPGWTAVIDGREQVQIVPVNYAFQGVPLPAGLHNVTLSYRPNSFVWGSILSLTTLAVLIIAAIIAIFPKRLSAERRDS